MSDRRPPCILIVDDEPAVLISHAIILERLGYEVVQANTAHCACQLLSRRRFDLLICDLSLDGASGLDVIAEALRFNPQLPVLLMTGFAGTVLPTHLAGADITILTKPMQIPAFLESVKDRLRRFYTSSRADAAD
jgi:DNA-binding NtrC family response regulator